SDSSLYYNGNPSPMVGSANANYNSKPSISKTDGPTSFSFWNIAFEVEYSPSDHDVWCASIVFDGTLGNDGNTIGVSNDTETDPAVSAWIDGQNGDHVMLVVYQRLHPGTPPFSLPQWDLEGTLYSAGGFTLQTTNLTTLLGAYGPHD